jgi:uncharacterized protein (DUF2062 family)
MGAETIGSKLQGALMTAWPRGLVAVVPCFNHGKTVAAVITGLRHQGAPVIMVDDGSTDDSAAEATRAGATVHQRAENGGKAAALADGLRLAEAAGYSHMLSVDADGQHPIEAVPDLVAASTNQPDAIILGARVMPHAPRASRLGRWLSNLSARILTGAAMGDTQTGLRIYQVQHCRKLPVQAGRYAFEPEILVRASWAGMPVVPVPVPVIYPPDRVSHFQGMRDNLHAVGTFLRLFLRALTPIPHVRVMPRRPWWRVLFTEGLSPGQLGASAGLGAAMGVAPIYGAQTIVALFLAWRLRLHMPTVLAATNISFGPLSLFWIAASVLVGRVLFSGSLSLDPFREVYRAIAESESWRASGEALLPLLGELLIGSLVIMVGVALICGVGTWIVARAVFRFRSPDHTASA